MAFTRTPRSKEGKESAAAKSKAGRYVKVLRESAELTQLDVSRALGEDYPNFVSQIECGRIRVPPEKYQAYAKILKVDVQEFAKELTKINDPHTYKALFGSK